MSLKNYPYEFSDDYEKLYNFLMEYQNYFIFGISDNDYEKIFKIRNVLENNVNAICFTDDNIYKKFALNHDEFLKICNELQLKWIKNISVKGYTHEFCW